jgi:ABC-2 type transport system permease protein
MTGTVPIRRQAPRRPAGFWRVTLAEWTKFRSVRSSVWTLLIATVLTVGLGVLFLGTVLDDYERMTAAERASHDLAATGAWYHGLPVGQVVIAILGVLVASSEYGTGTIRTTLAAVPSRIRVLAAKTVSVAVVALVAGAVQATAMFLVALPILADRSVDMSLTDPTALRGVALATLATMGMGLLGLGFGLLIRHSPGAIGAVVGVLLVISLFAPLLPASVEGFGKYLPPHAAWAMFGIAGADEEAVTLAPGPATAVFFGYVAALLVVAGMLFRRRDA